MINFDRITPTGGHKLKDTLAIVRRLDENYARDVRMKRAGPLLLMGAQTLLEVLPDWLREEAKGLADAVALAEGPDTKVAFQDEVLEALVPTHRLDKFDIDRGRDFLLEAAAACGFTRKAHAAIAKAIIDAAAANGAHPIPEATDAAAA